MQLISSCLVLLFSTAALAQLAAHTRRFQGCHCTQNSNTMMELVETRPCNDELKRGSRGECVKAVQAKLGKAFKREINETSRVF